MKLRHLIGIFLLTALTSCTTVTTETGPTTATPPSAASWKEREARLSRIQSWEVSGKIAVKTRKDAGSATVEWVKNRNSYRISLLGPLGSGGLKLTGSPGNVTLQTSDGKSYSADNAEQLLAERWGFHLPVSNLNYWMRGLPVPGMAANTQFDSTNRLRQVIQQGWRVQFLGYTNSSGYDLPDKVYITSSALDVKVIIYGWKIRG